MPLMPIDRRNFIVSAASLVARQRADVQFLLCGRGVESVDVAALTSRVHVLGERDDVEAVTAALDVAVSSSAYGESFPNAVVEALACEVPVVASRGTPWPELESRGCGLQVVVLLVAPVADGWPLVPRVKRSLPSAVNFLTV